MILNRIRDKGITKCYICKYNCNEILHCVLIFSLDNCYFENMNNILKNIDTIRRNKGYSQEYLAMQIGMRQAGFSLIMSGERELKYNTLLQIANVLQMSVIDVITFPEKYVLSKGRSSISTEAVLQIKLDGDKKDQILNIVLGEQVAELLKSR